jgi:hypothetical protein
MAEIDRGLDAKLVDIGRRAVLDEGYCSAPDSDSEAFPVGVAIQTRVSDFLASLIRWASPPGLGEDQGSAVS